MHSRKSESEDDSNWLLTFTDMITFLMAFFVIMYATQSLEAKERATMTDSIRLTMGQNENKLSNKVSQQLEQDKRIIYELQTYISESGLNSSLTVTQTNKGIELTATGGLAFASASDKLTAKGIDLLKQVSEKLKMQPYKVIVEGHTDDIPINTQRFPSNWELSTARATSVVRKLINLGISPGRLSASGYADTHPIAQFTDINTYDHARAKNRRVVLIIER